MEADSLTPVLKYLCVPVAFHLLEATCTAQLPSIVNSVPPSESLHRNSSAKIDRFTPFLVFYETKKQNPITFLITLPENQDSTHFD